MQEKNKTWKEIKQTNKHSKEGKKTNKQSQTGLNQQTNKVDRKKNK